MSNLNDQLLYVKNRHIKWLALIFFNMYDLKQLAFSKIHTKRLKIKLQKAF